MLFGFAIEKSNTEADLMQIELLGSEIDFVRTQIRNKGERSFVRRKSGTRATCSLKISQLPFILAILGGGGCSENYYLLRF